MVPSQARAGHPPLPVGLSSWEERPLSAVGPSARKAPPSPLSYWLQPQAVPRFCPLPPPTMGLAICPSWDAGCWGFHFAKQAGPGWPLVTEICLARLAHRLGQGCRVGEQEWGGVGVSEHRFGTT